jgi:hypothetical protein
VVREGLPGYPGLTTPVADERGTCIEPVRYGFRSFDRRWIIPDNRIINRPNPKLWTVRSERQVYMTGFTEESPTNGSAVTFTGLVPDLYIITRVLSAVVFFPSGATQRRRNQTYDPSFFHSSLKDTDAQSAARTFSRISPQQRPIPHLPSAFRTIYQRRGYESLSQVSGTFLPKRLSWDAPSYGYIRSASVCPMLKKGDLLNLRDSRTRGRRVFQLRARFPRNQRQCRTR